MSLSIKSDSDLLTKVTIRVARDGDLPTTDETGDRSALGLREVLIPHRTMAEGDVAFVDVALEFGTFWASRYGARFYFRLVRGRMVEEDGTTYLNSIQVDPYDPDSPTEFEGGWLPPSPGTENLEGWENPSISEEKRQELWRLYVASHPDAAPIPKRGSLGPPESNDTAGCGGSSPSGSLATSLALLALGRVVARRRKTAVLLGLFLTTLTGAVKSSHAKSVNGFIAFYENRSYNGSVATGSRLKTPGSSTTCMPSSTSDCVFRPVPFVRVTISDEAGNSYWDETDKDGFFDIQGVITNDPDGYSLRLDFENTANPRALIRLTRQAPPLFGAYNFSWKNRVIAPNSGPNFVGRIDFTTSDGASVPGDVAAIWHTVQLAITGLMAEGETRQNKAYTSPSGFDMILIRYQDVAKSPVVHCDNNTITVGGTYARDFSLASAVGMMYHARAVGCAPVTAGDWNFPLYPKNPFPSTATTLFLGTRTSEGLAFHVAWGSLVQLLTLWDPQTTALTDIKAVTMTCTPDGQANCVSDAYPNSNSAASVTNNVLALWELLDADTGDDDSDPNFNDTVDMALPTVMGALVTKRLSTELVYTPRSPPDPCSDNEGCINSGDACVWGLNNCFFGDPHGDNLADFTAQLASNTSNPQVITTILSSKCLVNNTDNTSPFCGAWRSD